MNKHSWTTHTGRYIFLSGIFGVVTTLFYYLGFGVVDHIEHLPIIIRSLDNTFLLNDFFTNASVNSIARLHFSKFISVLAGSEQNLPLVFLILTLCINIAISVITFSFGRNLFKNNNLAGIYASAFVMTLSTFDLGWGSTIYTNALTSSSLAIPLILGAILAVARGNPVVGVLLCSIASIIHPLMGLEMGGVLLITYVAFQLVTQRKITNDGWKLIIPSLLILAPFSLISLVPQFSQPSIDSNLFIYIIAHFRNPHHYVPSTFDFAQYIYAIAFLGATYLVSYRGKQNREESSSLIIKIIASIIILLCIGGYIFVELIPLRIWVIAQAFRLLYFVNWIGLVLIGGTMAGETFKNSSRTLYLVSVLHPISLGGVVLSQSLREWLERKRNLFSRILDPAPILLITIALLIYFSVPLFSMVLLGFYVLLILVFSTFPRKLLYSILLVGIVLTIGVGIYHDRLPYLNRSYTVNHIMDNLSLGIKSDLGPEGDEIVEFARKNTPEESIFLTPPEWGQFRLLARRAIVVDVKAFLFADIAMLEWYDRITNCYRNPLEAGDPKITELDDNYHKINDRGLLALQQEYDFSYAVLYNQTSTDFEVVFQNDNYKVVYLDGGNVH